MIKLLKHLKGLEVTLLIALLAFLVVQIYCDVTLPMYTAEIVAKMQSGAGVSSIVKTGLIMLGFAGVSVGATIIETFLAAKISARFSRRLRELVFNKVGTFSASENSRFDAASLMTRTTNDVQQVASVVVLALRLGIGAPLMATMAIIRIAQTSGELTFSTAIGVVLLLIGLTVIVTIVTPRFKVVQRLTDKLNGVTRENLTGIRVVRAYNAEGYQENKFNKTSTDLAKANLFTGRTMSALNPLISLVNYGVTLAIYWIGCFIIVRDNNAAFFPTMFSFTQLSGQVIMSFMVLLMLLIMMPRAAVSAKRINEVLNTKATITDPKQTKAFTQKGTIEFKNVSFKYGGAEEGVLKNVSFKLDSGETMAVVGQTGSGKSTLINLIPRFFEATEGELLINGINVKDVSQQTLRRAIGYVPQKNTLFKGSIKQNIALSNPNMTDEDILGSAKIACADEFIAKLDSGYDSSVSQGGKNFSGGQRQRLCIARALAANADIYIFDDSFSALDFATDCTLRHNLRVHKPTATKIIVAQRIGTIKDADKILVLSNGEVVGLGNHAQLMQTCELYQSIARSQLSEEELAL